MAQLGKWSQIAPFPTCLDVVSGELGVAARGRVKAASGEFCCHQRLIQQRAEDDWRGFPGVA
eukprot:2753075-Pyramimonas_sp.AAC.1